MVGEMAFWLLFLNPKLAIFFLALFSQFVTVDANWHQKAVMTITVGMVDLLWYCIVAFAISRGPILNTLKTNSHIVDKITGTFLMIISYSCCMGLTAILKKQHFQAFTRVSFNKYFWVSKLFNKV